jgi:hypothetical protein
VSTYLGHENGHRAFAAEDAMRYAKYFGVTLDWLLQGRGELDQPQRAMVGTPIIGAIDLKHWAEADPIDLNEGGDGQLEIAMLAGRRDEVWFAVRVPTEYSADGLHEGDFLICRQSDDIDHNRLGVVERTSDGGALGTLRQLTLVSCTRGEDGQWQLMIRPQSAGDAPKPLEGDYRVLGEVANSLRPF